jgi:hypothetical protein
MAKSITSNPNEKNPPKLDTLISKSHGQIQGSIMFNLKWRDEVKQAIFIPSPTIKIFAIMGSMQKKKIDSNNKMLPISDILKEEGRKKRKVQKY